MNSLPLTTPSPRRKAWFVLGFTSLYIAAQLFLIVRGHFVPSKHFGFWMFPESTFFTATLSRVLENGEEVAAKKGAWSVETESGKVRYKWKTFVNGYRMDELETRFRSKGTFEDTVKYFQGALDYVAVRIPEDKATKHLVLTIQFRRAGGPKETVVLKSPPRLGGARNGTT